jgi:DNA repair protein RadC
VVYTNAPSAVITASLKSTRVKPVFQSIGVPHEAAAGAREDALVIHEGGVHEASEGELAHVTRDPAKFEACMTKSRAMGPLDNSDKVYKLLRPSMAKQDQEVFVVVPLDLHRHLRGCKPVEVARGQRSSVAVAVVDVLRAGIETGATSIVVAHNHPSGLVKPSPKDLELTEAIIKGCKAAGLGIEDHLIIGTSRYYSIREHHKGLWK